MRLTKQNKLFKLAIFSVCIATLLSTPIPTSAQTCRAPYPFTTGGGYILNNCGERVRLHAVNWYGASSRPEVVGGLDKQTLLFIINKIKAAGFNAVRLPFSNMMIRKKRLNAETGVPREAVAKNPQFFGSKPFYVFEETIKALSENGILIILNNHTSYSEWCCGYDRNGLWFFFTNDLFPMTEDNWIADWTFLASYFKTNKLVIGADLRNEVRTAQWRLALPYSPTWGSGNDGDWRRAAEKAGNAILAVNSNLLIFVEAINWWGYRCNTRLQPAATQGERPGLVPAVERPITFTLNGKPIENRLVYSTHVYPLTGPRYSDEACDERTYSKINLAVDDSKQLRATLDGEWGWLLRSPRRPTPVWLSEFGVASEGTTEYREEYKKWFQGLVNYIVATDVDWGYWPLNGTKVEDDNRITDETYGILTNDWSDFRDHVGNWKRAGIQKLINTISRTSSPQGQEPFIIVDFATADKNLSNTIRGDWKGGARKGVCPDNYHVTGLSQAYKMLCELNSSRYLPDLTPAGSMVVTSWIQHRGQDWAPGSNKFECQVNWYVVGIAQDNGIAAVLCRKHARYFPEDMRLKGVLNFKDKDDFRNLVLGLWDPRNSRDSTPRHTAQCGSDYYVAGVATWGSRASTLLCMPTHALSTTSLRK